MFCGVGPCADRFGLVPIADKFSHLLAYLLFVVIVGRSSAPVGGSDVHDLEKLRAKEEMLVERAKQLLNKEEALMSLERQLNAKQEALYWRERCLRSEQLTVSTTTTTVTITDTSSMPPLIQIQPGILGLEQQRNAGLEQPRIVGFDPPRQAGLERRRVTLMRQPAIPVPLQHMLAARLMRQAQPLQVQMHAKPVQGLTFHQAGHAQIDAQLQV